MLEMTQHPCLYSLLPGAGWSFPFPKLPGIPALSCPRGFAPLVHRGGVRDCGFPSITRSYTFPLLKAHHILPAVEQLIPGMNGGHLQVVCGRALLFAELERKSWVFTEAAFLAALLIYHGVYYVFISLLMLIPVFIP